jgi:hypothetical protein
MKVKLQGSMSGFFEKHFSRRQPIDYLYGLAGVFCLCGLLGFSAFSAETDAGHTKKIIGEYALTSANDFPQRDPQDWQLMASNDEGKTWTILDIRKGEVFQARQQRKPYKLENQSAFEIYRLQIDKVRSPNAASSVQLAEVELIGLTNDNLQPSPVFSDSISAQGENPPAEMAANLFDGHAETKWLDWSTNDSMAIWSPGGNGDDKHW